MRKYEKTHPWINFQVDLTNVSPSFWMLLGEAKAKCAQIAGVPLQPLTEKRLHQLYMVKGVVATTSIEGNTLTEDEVAKHIEGKLEVSPSKQYQQREVQNMLTAFNKVSELVLFGRTKIESVKQLEDFNRIILDGLPLEEGVVPGTIRAHSVLVGKYSAAPAVDCRYLVKRMCDWINGEEFEPTSGNELAYAFVRAVVAHLYFAWIHPFGYGNGRTARLLEFRILLGAGVPLPAAHLLSNHYNHTRAEYYRQLDLASKSGGNLVPFLEYALRGFIDQLNEQLATIREQQLLLAWRTYVEDQFQSLTSKANRRRMQLVIDLTGKGETVPKAEIRLISASVERDYRGMTDKAISRDINELSKMGLIEGTSDGIRVMKEKLLSFLPKTADA